MNAQPITDEDRLRQMVLAELDYHMARDQTLVLLEDLGDAALRLRRASPELVVLVLIDPMQHYPGFRMRSWPRLPKSFAGVEWADSLRPCIELPGRHGFPFPFW
jgi:hypothetical protein